MGRMHLLVVFAKRKQTLPLTMSSAEVDFAAERRQLRRPDGSAINLPSNLQMLLQECVATLRSTGSESPCATTTTALAAALEDIGNATSADIHLKKISLLPPLLLVLSTNHHHSSLALVARCYVFPWLLDCRLRYAHKALIGIARTYFFAPLPSTTNYSELLANLFHTYVLEASAPVVAASRTCHNQDTDSRRSELAAHREVMVHLMNCMDSITVTLVPVYRDVFEHCFVATLPLLGEAVNWALNSTLVNATSTGSTSGSKKRSRSPNRDGREATQTTEASSKSTTTESSAALASVSRVFGEDVDLLRFFVRVTATHVHKFMQLPRCVAPLLAADGAEGREGLAAILCGASRMLSTAMLPKDVLNAAGLLVASVLTVSSLRIPVVLAACEAACANSQDGSAQGGSAAAHAWWIARARATLTSLVPAVPAPSADLVALCSQFSNIGRFAFFKGLLSHCQVPLQGNVATLPMLLLSDDTGCKNVVHDVIAANAIHYTSEVQEPDVRFMAIQTLDHVVRHIAGVLKCIAAEAVRAGDSLDATLRVSFERVCAASSKLRATVQSTVGMIMALWDDPTQQVSGPLYDTYRIVLSVNEGIASCRAALKVSASIAAEGDDLVMSPTEALQHVMLTQSDRRGKYHALLALIDVLPIDALMMSTAPSSAADDSDDDAARIRQFCAPLIAGSCNSKISSVCGEVLAAVAKKVMDARNVDEAGTTAFEPSQHPELCVFWRSAFVLPIVEAAAGGAASFRGLNVSSTQAVSNVVAHMMVPLLKRWPSLTLDVALQCVVERSGSSASSSSHWTQVAIETLFRARTCFIDTSAVVQPTNQTIFPLVTEALQSYDYELRMTAFGIAALSLRGAEPVTTWQCSLVERFVLLNMHQGGDSTARGAFLQNIGKWIRRLSDSVTSSKTRTGVPADPKKQKQLRKSGTQAPTPQQAEEQEQVYQRYVHTVFDHVARLVGLFAAHSGATVAQDTPSSAPFLSLERRFAALSAYATLLEALLPVFVQQLGDTAAPSAQHIASAMKAHPVVGGDESVVLSTLLPSSMIEPLLVTVSEGWDKIRLVAEALLEQFVQHNPVTVGNHLAAEVAIVSSPQFAAVLFRDTKNAAESDAIVPSASAAVKQLLSARFKDCEGVVRKLLLAIRFQSLPRDVVAARLESLTALLVERCGELRGMATMDVYRAIQARPLHGALSLCSALCSLLLQGATASPQREGNNGGRRVQRAADASAGWGASPVVATSTIRSLRMCSEVLAVCSKLVSANAVDGDIDNDDRDAGHIDCRGHVYHVHAEGDDPASSATLAADTEALSRIVVNNSWLGIRAAASFVETIVQTAPTQALPREEMSSTVAILMDTLLRTKHNGVMSKCRQTLKSICSALLRSKQAGYYSIPADALTLLLGESGVTSSDEARVLRRSQGLPHAILPMLESEDPTVPFSLFPMTMSCLFAAMAEDPSASTGLAVAHRVNALNVLKFIFDDKILGSRVVPYIQDAFVGAASGFRHSHWAVRNSSLMLFSSVLHRFIGDHPSTGGGGANTSFHDVASRIPRGIAFVLEALEAAVVETETTNFVQPALFPVLLMLSMLTPDAPHVTTHVAGRASTSVAEGRDEVGAARDDNAHAMKLVQRCRSIRNLMARGASAGALCGLVPVERLSSTIHELGQEMKRVGTNAAAPLDRNALHGALLHMHRLFGHYVGTIHSDAPTRISSRFHPTLARSVLGATLRVLSFAREELVVASTCPTVADVYLRIACDVLYYSAVHGVLVRGEDQDPTVELMCLRSTLACALTVSRHLCEAAQHTHSNPDVVASKARVGILISLLGAYGRSESVMDDLAHEQVQVIVRAEAKRMSVLDTISNRWNTLLWLAEALSTRCGANLIAVAPNRYHRDLFTVEQAADVVSWVDGLMVTARDKPYEHVVLDPSQFPATIAAANYVASGPLGALLLNTASSILDMHTSKESVVAVRQWSIAAFENITTVLNFSLTFRVWDATILTHECSRVLASPTEIGAFGSLLYRVLDVVPYSNAKSFAVQCLSQLQASSSLSAIPSAMQTFVGVVRACASADMPTVSRHSAVTAIVHYLVQSDVSLHSSSSTVVTLLATHFRLLFDDEEAIRRHACEAATKVAAFFLADSINTTRVPRAYCQVTCAYLLSSLIRQLLATQQNDASLVRQVRSILMENCGDATVSDETDTLAEKANDVIEDAVDEEEAEDDVLFEREAANMFEESVTMEQWVTLMTTAHNDKAPPPPVTLYFETLAQENAAALFNL